MKIVQPHVAVVARPQLDWNAIRAFLEQVGGMAWFDRIEGSCIHDGEALVEFGGRECYRSWDVGLNPNVTKVREDSQAYLENILASAHGSVLQHANYTFILHNVSRVFTHELVRHVAGTAVSQESMRYVRLNDLPVWVPDWAQQDYELMTRFAAWIEDTEDLQMWMAEHFDLDATKPCPSCDGSGKINQIDPSFGDTTGTLGCGICFGNGKVPAVPMHEKKSKTSFMRRWSPQGVATGMVLTANVRALRWIIERRTEASAEEEIRIIAAMIGECMRAECPTLFGDFEVNEEDEWVPKYRKV